MAMGIDKIKILAGINEATEDKPKNKIEEIEDKIVELGETKYDSQEAFVDMSKLIRDLAEEAGDDELAYEFLSKLSDALGDIVEDMVQ